MKISKEKLMPEGIIELDSEFGKQIGFTSDQFDGWLWYDHKKGRVWISFIESLQPGKGHLSALFAAIEKQGLRIVVPTPLAQLEAILERKGFVPHYEKSPRMGVTEVWEKKEG